MTRSRSPASSSSMWRWTNSSLSLMSIPLMVARTCEDDGMRILVASDLHYRLPHYDWLVQQALQFDVIALPGDHLDVAGAVPLDAQIVVLGSYFEKLSSATVLLTTSGNHDLDGPGAHGEQ